MAVPVWVAIAACRSNPEPDMWFPEWWDSEAEQTAKRICKGCPVRVECLNFAMAEREEGIWGGLTVHERKDLRMEQLWLESA